MGRTKHTDGRYLLLHGAEEIGDVKKLHGYRDKTECTYEGEELWVDEGGLAWFLWLQVRQSQVW
jgi:hypothetical protein